MRKIRGASAPLRKEKTMKLYKLFEQYVQYCYDLYQEKKWGKFGLHIMFSILGMVCAGILLSQFAVFVVYNFEVLAKVVGGIFLLIIMIAYILPKKKPEPPAQSDNSYGYDPVFLNSTYNLLRGNMISILAETADMLRLRVPSTPSQVEAPVHYDIISGAAIFHFLCGKQDPVVPVDSFEAIGILQNTLERRLNTHELMGISQTTTFYNGMAYPSIMVDNILDSGRYIQIDIAVTNENYLRYRTNRLYSRMDSNNSANPRDKNF